MIQYPLPQLFFSPVVLPDPDTLVIHVRSGDVMREKPGVKYSQPPLEFYKYVITTFHNDSPIIICTEVHAAADGKTGGNPVVEALLRWRPSILFPDNGLRFDAGVVLGARHLVVVSIKL